MSTPARAPVRILVIDDDAAQRDLLTRFLEREGFSVRTAPDGRAGLELARTVQPRAILLDVMMPGMDGLEVCKALRAKGSAAPILMLTAKSWPVLPDSTWRTEPSGRVILSMGMRRKMPKGQSRAQVSTCRARPPSILRE